MKPGIHHGISMSDYLAFAALSSSTAHALVTRSPLHARYRSQFPEDANNAMDAGSAAHKMLLEGTEDGIAVIDAEDWRTKAAKEAREAAHAAGTIPILAGKMSRFRDMVKEARAYLETSEIAGVFEGGKPEVTMIWQDGDALCKARQDWMTDDHGILLHYKTTQGSAEPNSWIRNQMVPMGYDVAAAFYERGLRACGSDNRPCSVFLVQETEAPYACSLVSMSNAMADIAAAKVERAISTWAQCQRNGKWPGYPTQICYAEPFNWQLQDAEEQAMRDELQEREGLQA